MTVVTRLLMWADTVKLNLLAMLVALLKVRRCDLHFFGCSIPCGVVNHDGLGGTALDAVTWERDSILKESASSQGEY